MKVRRLGASAAMTTSYGSANRKMRHQGGIRLAASAATVIDVWEVMSRRPWIGDVALSLVFAAWAVQAVGDRLGPASALLALLQTLPLILRRKWPWVALVVIAAAYVVSRSAGWSSGLSPAPAFLAVAVYSTGRYAAPPRSLASVAIVFVALVAPELPDFAPGVEIVVLTLAYVAAWALGASQRRIRADAARLRELARELHAEQQLSAHRAALAERARIARDLHDVVAHHVSAIAVQARASLDAGALDGVSRIAETADTALVEMRRLLGLLGDEDVPSLDHLEQLAAPARAIGCAVTIAADAPDIPLAVAVSAYRIVQESLTNIVKHAGACTVHIGLRRDAGDLLVTVANSRSAVATAAIAGSGAGLVGMRERAALFGGTVRAGAQPDGGWLVTARIPA